MNTDDILAEIGRLVGQVLGTEPVSLTRATKASDVPNWDSLNHIEIVLAVEKHFKIKFNFLELQKFKNIGDMADGVLAKLPK